MQKFRLETVVTRCCREVIASWIFHRSCDLSYIM